MAPVKRKKPQVSKGPAAPRLIQQADSSPAPEATHSPSDEAVAKIDPQANLQRELSARALPSPSTPMDIADQLHSAAIHLLRRLRIRDRQSGIGPAQLSALSVLVFGGPRSLGELADAEQVRAPTMSRIAAGLQRSGLVRRHGTEDGRRIQLEATRKGTKIMWEGRQRRVESLAEALASLPENERQELREAVTLLQQVIRNL
jgi:DNA-binding MarR family transcriptional regulator